MNYYLVDYENVNSSGLDGITGLSDDDTVIIFYSEKAETMTFGLHRRLNETPAAVQFQRVDVGQKNALDFQLASYLGFLISDNINTEKCSFYIVSKDQGFSCLVSYWTKRSIKLYLINEIAERKQAPVSDEEESSTAENDMLSRVTAALPDKHKSKAAEITEILKTVHKKVDMNTALMRKYKSAGNVTAKELYKALKPFLD